MTLELSIISGTVNRGEHLAKFVDSIITHTDIPYELILLNAGDGEIRIPNYPECKIIREYPRLGFAKGYNRGFKEAQGRYVVYLNDDCVVTPHWAIRAIQFMDKNPWCGLGALYFSESGPNGPFQIRQWLNLYYANFGIIKRELGEQLGWIDEFLHTYGSDNSISFKVMVAGYAVAGIPDCKILHNPIVDKNKMENINKQPEDARNLLLKYRPLLPRMYEVMSRMPQSREYV